MHRTLQSIPHSKIAKKCFYLIGLNNKENNICFAGSLAVLTAQKELTDAELLIGAKEFQNKLSVRICGKGSSSASLGLSDQGPFQCKIR